MTRTEELLALAEATIKERPARNRLYKLQDAADPETIKQLVELVRLQHEALELASMRLESALVENAITAFKRLDKGGE